jgi:hypothetical protein
LLKKRRSRVLYAVLFTDDPAYGEARQRLMQDHLAFLERHREAVLAAGPLRDTVTGEAAGGLWLVQASGSEEVEALYRADPFWPTGLRKQVRVLEWRQVFASGSRL